jgi:hypothetical protein
LAFVVLALLNFYYLATVLHINGGRALACNYASKRMRIACVFTYGMLLVGVSHVLSGGYSSTFILISIFVCYKWCIDLTKFTHPWIMVREDLSAYNNQQSN